MQVSDYEALNSSYEPLGKTGTSRLTLLRAALAVDGRRNGLQRAYLGAQEQAASDVVIFNSTAALD